MVIRSPFLVFILFLKWRAAQQHVYLITAYKV